MSLISNDQNNSQRRHGLPKLNVSSQIPRWKRDLEVYLFSRAKINDLDKLTARSYLDDNFFKKTFKEEQKVAVAALPEGQKQHPLKHPPYLELCVDGVSTTPVNMGKDTKTGSTKLFVRFNSVSPTTLPNKFQT